MAPCMVMSETMDLRVFEIKYLNTGGHSGAVGKLVVIMLLFSLA